MTAPMNALALASVLPDSKQPVHDEGVEDEDDAEDGLPEMDGGMFVVVAAAAIVVVLVVA